MHFWSTDILGRKVFIITYSQAAINKFPRRSSFGVACVAACEGGKNVYYFAAAREPHKKGGLASRTCMGS